MPYLFKDTLNIYGALMHALLLIKAYQGGFVSNTGIVAAALRCTLTKVDSVCLQINQQCKFFKGLTNPLGGLGYDEGALCTPQVCASVLCTAGSSWGKAVKALWLHYIQK